MPFPAYFRPQATDDLVRIGSPGDGGYVLPERVLGATRGLLSMGLCDDWSFEADVHRRTAAPLAVFDHSVDARFWMRRFAGNLWRAIADRRPAKLRRALRFFDYRRFFDGDRRRHIRRAIGRREHGFVDLEQAMAMAGMERDILLKIDIEGAEYRILDQVVAHRDRFVCIALELHDIDVHEPQIAAFLAGLDPDFVLVHFHANNCTTFGPPDLSIVVELTLLNRALLRADERLAYRPLPIAGLDAKNLPDEPDVVVAFA